MKRFATALFLFTVLYTSESIGQSIQMIDSINEVSFSIRSAHRDSSRVLAYEALRLSNGVRYKRGVVLAQLNLGIHYCNRDVLDSAAQYLDLAYDYLVSSKEEHYLGVGAWYKAKLYQKLNNFKRAFSYLDKAEEVFRKQKDDKFLIYVLTERGVYYGFLNDYSKALECYLETIKLNLGSSDEFYMRLRANIASTYVEMKMYDEALEYAEDALMRAYRIGFDGDIAQQLYIVGIIFKEQGNDDSTIFYLNKSYEYALRYKSSAQQAMILSDIADFFQKKGDLKKANGYLLQAEKYGTSQALSEIYLNLSKNYEKRGIGDSSLFYLYKASSLAKRRESLEYLLPAYKGLMDYYDKHKILDSAFFYAQEINALSEKIYNEKKDRRFDNVKVQLETLEKENEINELKFTQYESRVRNRIFLVVAIFLFLTVTISFLMYRINQRKKHMHLEQKRRELEKQLEISQKKLSNHTLSMIQKNNVFEEIESELKGIRSRCNGNIDPGIKKIQRDINMSKTLENDWNNFANLFGEIHSTFFTYFEKQHPDLSDYEMRLCALIKMRLTNKEIATMLNIEHKSVKMAKYRLKKKLEIEEEIALSDFIARIE